jgi:hypothetical protein
MKDFHDLTHLTNLSTLTLDTCKHLDKLTFVDSLKNLKTLDVSNCGVIESLHPVMKLPYLERLSFIESTDIEDGNIAQLKDHPSLQWVLFQDRKHYDAKRNEFEWKINTDSKHYE